jgi:exopolysaccharide production protein ExoY
LASIPIPRQAALPSGFAGQIGDFSERVGAAILLACLFPVLCICAAAVALLSGRTPLIAHRRVGWRGNTLWMLKLRTMWDFEVPHHSGWIEYIDDQTGPEQKQEMDARVRSRLARFCRRHSIDELPQLIHVLRGEMSLVGPRPGRAGGAGSETRPGRSLADLGA